MSLTPFAFTKDWTNPTDFPAVENDSNTARSNIQLLHDETKNEINTIISEVNGKQLTITANGLLKGNGSGGVSSATAGTDYLGVDNTITHLVGGALKTLSGTTIPLGARITYGTYVGTGTYGENNKNSLTFDYTPKLLFVQRLDGGGGFLATQGTTQTMPLSSGSFGYEEIYTNMGSNTVYWYSDSAAYQYNRSGVTYGYLALG